MTAHALYRACRDLLTAAMRRALLCGWPAVCLIAPPAFAQSEALGTFPYWAMQLPRQHQECISAFARTGDPDKVTRLDYTLVPERTHHRGLAVDVYVAYRTRAQPERWLLQRGGGAPSWVEYRPGSIPPPATGDTPLTLADFNPITIIDAPASAPVNLETMLQAGAYYVGYGLRDAANGSFQEMIESQRFGPVMRHNVYVGVRLCFPYTRIRVRPKAGPTGNQGQ